MTTVRAASGVNRRGHALGDPFHRVRLDSWVRLIAGTALWLGLLLVTYWWAAGGGLRDLAGWQSGLTSTGRLTGLVASDLLLVQVLLMARLPVLEGAFGQDRLARIHRIVGFTSFNLMLAHVVLITWGYAAGQVAATPRTFWQLTTGYPGMLLALGGTVALMLVVFTSIKAARRRIRYESWHLLHLYAYLGVGLALPHQLWTGQQFLTSTAATVYWWTLWAAAAAAVLVFRVGLPLWRSARHRVRVTSVVHEGDGTVSVYMTGRHLEELGAEAGQFFTWRFLGRKGWTRAHPYSLSAAPDARSLRISVKALGDDSAGLSRLRPGTPVLLEGPYGRLSPRARSRHKVAFIGAGVGITPLRALAEGLPYRRGEAVLLYRFHDQPLFVHELNALERERGLDVLYLPGRRRSTRSWLGDHVGTATDLTALRFWVPDLVERDLYVCGPEPWAAAVRETALAAGLPPEQFHLETFSW
ncbi:ferredoxin reductase family protein [Nocardioides mesophilus]|uniref:Ferric reductase-like transmembrane domain-containing protein n=1 Tax=Nocardioides mesophilus TaxID=433659 RepID=A0A7G9RG29_9ACTN|nr:ferredoxin reductase family protein [Nocardioides mesophilus]QNN54554.1 ferric reductase-like transmembrane domain-containing protein [Nocardioides mesophilus]